MAAPESHRGRLREVALLFARLGFTAFGGPVAHVAMMEEQVVRRRNWLDRQHFLDLVAAVNFIPGPNSTELAIHLGYLRAGWAGLLVAGLCFIAPAVLIILPLAWAYVTYGALPHVQGMMSGVNACVIAIIAVAASRFARTGIKDAFTGIAAVLSVATAVLLGRASVQPELAILAVAALSGALWYVRPRQAAFSLLLVPFPAELASIPVSDNLLRMALFFLKVGATMFGSGYVLVSYLQSGLVDDYRWLSQQQLLDAIAVGQVTPGPLLTTATFIGYVLGAQTFAGGPALGVACGLLVTAAIFLPSFCFVACLGPLLPRIRQNRLARGALDGLNAAVVALILLVTLRLARTALHDVPTVAIALLSLVALLRNINSTWLILAAAVAGGLLGWTA